MFLVLGSLSALQARWYAAAPTGHLRIPGLGITPCPRILPSRRALMKAATRKRPAGGDAVTRRAGAGAGARVRGRDPPRPKAPGRDAAPDRRGADRGAGAPREPEGRRCPRLDEWVDVRASRLADLDALLAKLGSSDVVELEVLDDEGERRGNLMAQVIGRGLDEQLGVSCIFIYPLAAEKREVLDWAIANLAAPNAVHLCRRPAPDIDLSGAADFVQKVERWRIRDPAKVTEAWAAHAVKQDAGPLAMKKAHPDALDEAEEIVVITVYTYYY